MLTNQTPRKLFDVLIQYDENAIGTVPASGPLLSDFLRKYYQFENDTRLLENDSLGRIGGMVAVRFPAGWGIYLRYVILRFSGMSKAQVIAGGDFLNYDITWEDAERVYSQLSSDPLIAQRFSNTVAQYKGFIETCNKLAASAR
jgi:hypothetical protein